jgi:hypothetical protein
MTTTTEALAKPKATLSSETRLLFFIAARSHNLAEQFGVELKDGGGLTLHNIPRPWLVPKFDGSREFTFNPDCYAATLDDCSDYTRHMRLWILNVWNPHYAKKRGWTFDLFAALRGLDSGNVDAIAHHMKLRAWP